MLCKDCQGIIDLMRIHDSPKKWINLNDMGDMCLFEFSLGLFFSYGVIAKCIAG